MNAKRRQRINAVVEKLAAAGVEVDALRDEEQDAFDSTPDSLKESDRARDSEAAAEALDSASDSVTAALDSLQGIG